MPPKPSSFAEPLEKFKSWLLDSGSEKARQHNLYPLFQVLYRDRFKIETAAQGADVYVEGILLVEAKSDFSQWLEGFYQALHYHRKFGLNYHTVIVLAHKFVGIWKLNKLPEYATILVHTADAHTAPNVIGKENARKTNAAQKAEIKNQAFYWLEPNEIFEKGSSGTRYLTHESFEILNILKNLDSDRLQINTHNFIGTIEQLKRFYTLPIDAVHAFYAMVAYWDINSVLAESEYGEFRLVGFKGNRLSEALSIAPKQVTDFKKFVENRYIFTNEGSGLSVDYYFSRFDEVLAIIDPKYVKQHGIFFTSQNLSRFALWFAKKQLPNEIESNYIVFDPAAGSGNLVSSWRGKLKHKIVSELQPDLLKTIERRMRADPFHIETGFTIIPKAGSSKGLNFIAESAELYYKRLERELSEKNLQLDKPLAFLLNPPYKNTDEKEAARSDKEAQYEIDPSILEICGEDASKERYLAFLGQIINLAKTQCSHFPGLEPVLLVFTPTSWLIPRPTYEAFRKTWDRHFKYRAGFMVNSNTWFKLEGKWPLAFTVWDFKPDKTGHTNTINLQDLTNLRLRDLDIEWDDEADIVEAEMKVLLENKTWVLLNNSKGSIREWLPLMDKKGIPVRQSRYNFYRKIRHDEIGKYPISGFPLADDRHQRIQAPHGEIKGQFIGFMDNNTPCRIGPDTLNRLSNKPDRVWQRLDLSFIDINKTKIHSGPSDSRSFCAYDLPSAKAIYTWFALCKALNGKYPMWANQFYIWPPNITPAFEKYWYSLCFALALAENRCIVTKFEADNPVPGAPEVFVDNPLCPTNRESFWATTLQPEIGTDENAATALVAKITELYKYWNLNYCKAQFIRYVGLEQEPYFKYFNYPDFLTPYSGLLQIKRFAEINSKPDLLAFFTEITDLTKPVKDEIYRLLTEEFSYFG